MNARAAILVATLLACVAAAAAAQEEPAGDPARTALQAEIESGADLDSRARKVLFRARNHQDVGRYAEALKLLDEWLAGGAEREHPLLRFQQAIAQLGLGNREAAQTAFRAAVTDEPRFARAWLRLAETAYDRQDYAVAAEAFGRGYELGPVRRPEYLYYRCVALLSGDRPADAVDDLVRLLGEHRADAGLDWYRALIAATTSAETPEPARPLIANLLADFGGDDAAWELAYRFATGNGDYESAAVYLTVTGYLRDLSAEEWNRLGDLYAVIDVPLQAARCYEAAMADSATSGTSATSAESSAASHREFERVAGAWLAAHRLDEARDALRAGLARRPTKRLWTLLADLEYQAENYAAALEAYTNAVELAPDFGRGWLMRGYCAKELGRQDEAREALERAAEFPEQAAGAAMLLTE